MANITSPFYDNLICHKNYESINLAPARVETKTFILFLAAHLNLIRRGIPESVVSKFFDCYDDMIVKMAEVDRFVKDPVRFRAQTNCMSDSEITERQLRQLGELGRREEPIRQMIEKLQYDLFDAADQGHRRQFESLLYAATKELREMTNHLYELIEAD